ncbi:hypothetical protein DL96DRAFT_1611008 [Flagelloscypha sp. PMI_526]|nr:hypothetical protein DL96DRAFT_1611008 [Flagelloscypha sp. PMI_526]
MRDWWYGIEEDRTDMPLTRLTELMNPMANTLVYLDIDAWPILHPNDRKITNHPFFIGQYPHLRYFYIRLGVPRFREHDDLQVEDLATQIAWLSSMLCEKPSTYSHPLSYINIHLDKWWWLDHTNQPTQITWHTLDLALAGNHSITYTHLKELQLSPVFEVEDATYDIEKLLPLALERGVLVVTKEREGWSLLR